MSGVNGEALTALVDRFNEENTYGITVDAEFEGEYDDAINKLKSSMVGGSGPDLIQVYEIGTRFHDRLRLGDSDAGADGCERL